MDRVRTTSDRNFWAGFTAAAVLHAALIFAASSSTPRQLGESDGLQDAISVELVEPETLAGAGPHEGEPSTEPASDSRPLQLPRQPTDAWQTSSVPDKPDQPQAAASQAKPEQQAMLALPDPDAAKVEEPQEEPSKEPQKPNEAHKEQKQQKETHKSGAPKSPTTKDKLASPQLDFSLPSNFSLPSGGGGASAVMRPSGITRSGENDEFGRDVVKALRKTMPAHEKIFGRVTVRILLSEKGDLIDLQLLKGSGSSYLDQVVMFSARQAVYPFPPKGSTAIDRTFVITYIYS
ncbi:MAG TPA: TonB family protein [Hyphomicrobiaceae bacterium]|nr:TonB family protein [Hyphomicrobiaceae bacterium]